MDLVGLFIAISLVACLYLSIREPFRGHRRHHGMHRDRHRMGWGGGGYVRQLRRRGSFWNGVNIWPTSWYQWAVPCNCKRGCTPDGCAFPGNGPNDCVWASDCNCC